MSTKELAVQSLQQMHAPEDVNEEVYIGNLAIFVSWNVIIIIINVDEYLFQRKFVRLSEDDKSASYHTFRQWLGTTSITEEQWAIILEEDEAFDYLNLGVGSDEVQQGDRHEQPEPQLGAQEEVYTAEFKGGD